MDYTFSLRALIGVAIIGAGYLHINGWTGEPKEKYYELMHAARGRHPKLRAFVPAVTVKAKPED
jgi:hypothetical protein